MSQGITAEADLAASSDYVQTMNKILFIASGTAGIIASGELFADIFSAGNFKTRCLLYLTGTSVDVASYLGAYVGRAMSTNFYGSNTAQTMHLKTLATVEADENITQTILNRCAQIGVDTYPSFQGIGKVFCQGKNLFFDEAYNLAWFVAAIEIAGFNALAQSSTKVPQTEQGMEYLKGAYRKICNQAVVNGFVAAGAWNSSDIFGNQEDMLRNIAEIGYYIYSQPVSEQLQSQRALRRAPVIQVAVKQAGAIHSTSVIINVNA
jgi:hypothetical protein